MAFSLTGDAGCESGCRGELHNRQKNAARQVVAYKQSFLGLHAVQPLVVSPRSLRLYARRRDRLIIRAAIWCYCRQSTARLQLRGRRTSRRIPETLSRPGTCLQTFDYHAQPIHHLSVGVQSPACECAVLERAGRYDTAGWKQRKSRIVCGGFERFDLVSGFAQNRRSRHHGNSREILIDRVPSLDRHLVEALPQIL